MRNINQLRVLTIIGIVAIAAYVIYNMPINLGLDLQGGTRLVLEGYSTDKVKVSDDSMSGVLAVIRNRIDALGVSEPTIQRKGRKQVVVELPGVKDPERAISLIGDTALLEFVVAEWAPGGVDVMPQDKIEDIYGKGARIDYLKGESQGEKFEKPIILKKSALTGADLKGAWPDVDEYGNPVVSIEFNAKGTNVFGSITAQNVNKPIAIILDNTIISAPNVREPIPSGRAQISGDFTIEEVQDLVIKLKAGALPIPVRMVETRIVGPTLGRDSVEKSKVAGIIGFAIVIAFMIMYYRLPGLVADLALVVYLFIVFGVLSLIHATLTLPGIAGFLLSIGMAVDANIIIFERLKEELREGKTIKMSIEASFIRAFSAILDSNVTTVLAALTLFWLGTGTIRGFALILIIGILSSMFTAIVVTRMLLYILVDSKVIKSSKSKLVYR